MTMTSEQRADRRNGIGASEAAAACGLSPWRTPLELYLEKVGEGEAQPETPPMYWGRVLEDIVATEYARRTDRKLRRRPTMRSAAWPWMFASLDRTVDGQPIAVECKTAGRRTDEWGEPGTDEVPPHYLCQVAHQLAVARNYSVVEIPVLFLADRDFEIYRIERDEELEAQIIERERSFWRRVEERDPPPPTSPGDVRLRWPRDDGSELVCDDGLRALLTELAGVRGAEREAAARRSQLEADIQAGMAEHVAIVDPRDGAVLATWKTQTTRRIDVQALQAEHPELASRYRKEAEVRRFLLKSTTTSTTQEAAA